MLFNVVGNHEVKPLSSVCPFIGTKSILFDLKIFKELLNISEFFVETKSSSSIQIAKLTLFFKICSLV